MREHRNAHPRDGHLVSICIQKGAVSKKVQGLSKDDHAARPQRCMALARPSTREWPRLGTGSVVLLSLSEHHALPRPRSHRLQCGDECVKCRSEPILGSIGRHSRPGLKVKKLMGTSQLFGDPKMRRPYRSPRVSGTAHRSSAAP